MISYFILIILIFKVKKKNEDFLFSKIAFLKTE